MYAPARQEVRAVQRLYMSGRQSSLYKWLIFEKLPQPGPYAVFYCTKAYNQREPNHREGQIIRTDPLPGHQPGRISPICTDVLTQRPHDRSRVSCITRMQRQLPSGPSAHQDHRPQPPHTGGCWRGKINANLTQPMDSQTTPPSPPANPDSDGMSVAII